MVDYLVPIAILILIITGLIETYFSATWHKKYFNSGVLAMVRNIQVNNHQSHIPSCELFNNKFQSGCLGMPRSLRFEELGPHIYGFRESLFPLGRWAMLHGILVFDDKNNQVTVKGFFDWTILCLVLILLIVLPLAWLFGYVIPFDEPVQPLAGIYFGSIFIYLVVFYLSNYFRFSAVASFAAESWS